MAVCRDWSRTGGRSHEEIDGANCAVLQGSDVTGHTLGRCIEREIGPSYPGLPSRVNEELWCDPIMGDRIQGNATGGSRRFAGLAL